MREISFATIEGDEYNIGFTEGVFKIVGQPLRPFNKPIHPDPCEAIKLIVKKARKDFPLKFLPSENPFVEAIQHNNIFKLNHGDLHIVFTAANYNGKDTVFVFIWEELDAQVQDGQNKVKTKWYNSPR